MIRTFSAENFLSIDAPQRLDFKAKPSDAPFVQRMPDGTALYKIGILYGANSSGKSNMLLALDQIFQLLVRPRWQSADPVRGYRPFALNAGKPTRLAVQFYANGTLYDYSVSFDATRILSEELHYYPRRAKALYYRREHVADDVQPDIVFGGSLALSAKTRDSIRENVLNNHTVLSVCAKNTFKEDARPLTDLHTWIMDHYHEIDGDQPKENLKSTIAMAFGDERRHRFYKSVLAKADLNIVDFRPVKVENRVPEELRSQLVNMGLPETVKQQLLNDIQLDIRFTHRAGDATFDLPMAMLSKGTIKYLRIIDALYDMVQGNHVYYLDELGEDLHYDLLAHYINLFLYNSENSQLIITSQETALLQEALINDNRALVWLVEKDPDTAASQYDRGDTFGLHKNLSFYSSYNIGRLGAKPALGSFFLDLD